MSESSRPIELPNARIDTMRGADTSASVASVFVRETKVVGRKPWFAKAVWPRGRGPSD